MTPEQKIKRQILLIERRYNPGLTDVIITVDNVDELFEEHDSLQDAIEEFRSSGIETSLPTQQWSRHYEYESVARQVCDGSWVGWTYFHGGGKHGEPEAIDWMDSAYEVNCVSEERLVIVNTFSMTAKTK